MRCGASAGAPSESGTIDASTPLEMLGFTGPEAQEGLSSLREKRGPTLDPKIAF